MAFLDFVPALGGLVNSGLNAIFGMDQSKKLMRYQSELQQKMIDQANLYNHPYNQMARLREAGLNPNLVYGSGVSGNQSESGKVSAVSRDAGVDLNIDAIAQMKLQRQMTQQAIKNSQWQAVESMTRATQNMLKNKLMRQTFSDQVRQIHEDVEHTIQSIRESAQRVNESQERTNNLIIEANRIAELGKQEAIRTQLMKQYSADEMRSKIAEVKARTKYYDKQREVADSVMKLNDAKIHQLEEDVKWLASRTHGQDLENQLTERMQKLGLQGMTAKDFFVFLKDIIISFIRN